MDDPLEPGTNCPDCRASGSVRVDVCDVCLADLGERRAPARRGRAPGPAPDTGDLRFSDVVSALRAVVDLAELDDDGSPVAAAGVRAERLLGSLRRQFLRDLGLPRLGGEGAQ